jgi:parvulin-like peptidyl-prolyl isomerase
MDGRGAPKGRTLAIAAAVAAVVAAAAGIGIYLDQVAPFRATVLVVGDRSVTMRYFLKRVSMSGQAPLDVLQALVSELIIRDLAPEPPYNIEVTDQDVDRFLRDLARGGSETIKESDFKEWYRQKLNETRLSDAEFRDLARTNVMTVRLTDYLARRVPTVAEQVHLRMIPLRDPADAARIKARLQSGESFGALARELSSDPKLRDNGGDIGWFPRGALPPQLAKAAFDDLKVGEASDPLGLGDQTVVIFVAEKATRQVEGDSLEKLKASALSDWVRSEYQYEKVEFHGFHGGYDSETDAWVKWQLQRMKR